MVHGMITIVPAHRIVLGIDAINSAGKIIFGIVFINERMLGPIAEHHHHTRKNKRYNEYPKRSLEIDKTHTDTE